jgi:DNA repair exonuclease SbcCD ATPase subunit
MPKTIKDPETGEEMDVYEREEFEQEVSKKLEEEKTKIQEEWEEKEKDWSGKEQEFQTQLEEKEKELEELKSAAPYDYDDSKKNFAKLREQVKAKEKEIKDIKTEFQKEIGGLRTSMQQKEVDAVVSTMAGSDQNLKDKILHHYGRIKDEADTRDQIVEKMKDAYVLATGDVTGNPLAQAMGTGGSAPGKREETVSEDVKDIGMKRFGLTDEDFKQHGKPKQ